MTENPEEQPSATGVDALARSFAVFRRSKRGQPPLPASVIDQITHDANARYGLDSTKAQYLTVAGLDVWLVPGAAGVCVVLPAHSSMFTTSLAKALSGGLVIWRMGPGDAQTVIGFVPDTNKTVHMTTGDGEVVDAPVVNNMYTATTTTPFRIWQVRNASGELQPVAKRS